MHWSHAEEGQKFFTKQLKGRKSFILLAQDGDKAVGYILIKLEKYAWRAFLPIAEVGNISVDPAYRGKGIGTKLFQKAKVIAKKRGAKRMSVESLTTNAKALKFYKRNGFKDFSETLLMKLK